MSDIIWAKLIFAVNNAKRDASKGIQTLNYGQTIKHLGFLGIPHGHKSVMKNSAASPGNQQLEFAALSHAP